MSKCVFDLNKSISIKEQNTSQYHQPHPSLCTNTLNLSTLPTYNTSTWKPTTHPTYPQSHVHHPHRPNPRLRPQRRHSPNHLPHRTKLPHRNRLALRHQRAPPHQRHALPSRRLLLPLMHPQSLRCRAARIWSRPQRRHLECIGADAAACGRQRTICAAGPVC